MSFHLQSNLNTKILTDPKLFRNFTSKFASILFNTGPRKFEKQIIHVCESNLVLIHHSIYNNTRWNRLGDRKGSDVILNVFSIVIFLWLFNFYMSHTVSCHIIVIPNYVSRISVCFSPLDVTYMAFMDNKLRLVNRLYTDVHADGRPHFYFSSGEIEV